MMMNMLKAGGLPILSDGIRKADQDNPQGYLEFEPAKRLREGNDGWLADARGKAVKLISELLFDLPETHTYQVVFMLRDLSEVLASQAQMLRNLAKDPDNVEDAQFMEIMKKHLAKVRSWIDASSKFDCMYLEYSVAIKDPLIEAARVNSFLKENLDVEAMAQIVDPGLYRQRVK